MQKNDPSESKAREVVSLLKKYHQHLDGKKSIAKIAVFIAVLVASVSILILFEGSFYFPAWVKSGVLLLFLIGAVGAVIKLSNSYKTDSFRSFYEDFFTKRGQEEVLSAIDLYLDDNQKKSRFYTAAIHANLKDVKTQKLSSDLQDYIDQSKISKGATFSSIACGLSLILAVIVALSLPNESVRALHFWNGYDQPNPFTFTVHPADTTIEHGSAITVGIQYQNGSYPSESVLEFKTNVEENYRQRQMQAAEEGTFRSSEIELTNDITYRVTMDGFQSEEFTIDVQLQPRFDQLTATVTPPSYTGLPVSEYEYPFSEIPMYPGSELIFRGITNKPVQFVRLNQAEETLDLQRSDTVDNQFEISINPEKTDTLTFAMTDQEGLKNRNPFRTILNIREDQYPVIVIQEPTGTVMQTEPSELQLIYQATDDFGLSRADLTWSHTRAFTEEPETGSIRLSRPGNGKVTRYQWNLENFDLRPRDELTFSIRVWDNDQIAGSKMSESEKVVLQIPSLTEYFDELDDREQDVQSELEEVSDQFETIEREYQEFLDKLRQNPEGGFEEQQMLEEVQERQQQIDETVQNLNEKFQQLRNEMEQSNRVSEETQQSYRELQQLMEELDDPSLREAMEELQRALENLSPQEVEQAMENVSFNENLYRERLQRTVELFKRLKMNSDLDKLAQQYEDMAERMKPEEGSSLEQLSNEMETVREDLQSIEEQLEQLDTNPPKNSEERLRELKESSQQQLDSTRQEMNQLQEQGESESEQGENSPSEQMQQQQQQISENLKKEAEKFRSAMQQMSGQQIQVNILALQRSLYTLLELSEMEEYLAQSVADTRSRSQGYVDLARVQQNVNDQFSAVADTLFEVSAELPGIPNQINRKKEDVERRLNQTMDQMVDRSQRGSTVASREALGGINDLTSMVASLLDQLMNQQGGGGMGKGMTMQQMIQQLQNMSGNQQQLNQQLQQMINDAQGDRLSREQSERLNQMARQQNEIRKQLEELQRNGALQQGDRMLSELQRMMEDMEDSINDMRGGVTDPLMIERQQNILSRMLSAEESMQQRGEEDEREGTTRSEFDRILPPDITLEELQQEIRARMQDPNFTRFSEKYQRLIEQYFERLRRLEQESLP
ncbi:DUF4175 family protein [Rhodohalobacter sp. 614A]|uniref:DUF4175 family protein n=1 Tax=Rhodohalobacter sp. 614A TaxID=2908649 RepID=UPI001F2A3686|nr:DUF4175 family protein [Rhodohalobacter sp. 614A]